MVLGFESDTHIFLPWVIAKCNLKRFYSERIGAKNGRLRCKWLFELLGVGGRP